MFATFEFIEKLQVTHFDVLDHSGSVISPRVHRSI